MSTTPRPSRVRRIVGLSILVVLIIIVVVFWSDIALMGKLAYVAQVSFSNGIQAGGIANPERDMLMSYSPQKLAPYLESSWPKWRAAVCQILQYQAATQPTADWSGIAARLAQMRYNDPDPDIRELARVTLQKVPSVSPGDVEAMLAQANSMPPGGDRRLLLRFILDKSPDRERCRELLLKQSTSQDPKLRADAILILVEHFEETELARKALGDLLTGSPEAQAAALSIVRVYVARQRAGSGQRGRGAGGRPPESPKLLDEELVKKIEQTAASYLASDNAEFRDAALQAALVIPTGATILLKAAVNSEPARREELLYEVAEMPRAAARGQRFQFTPEDSEILVGMLADSSADVREAAASIIQMAFSPRNPFPAGKGPLNPAHRDLFTKLWDGSSETLLQMALQYHLRVAPNEKPKPEHLEKLIRKRIPNLDALKLLLSAYPKDKLSISVCEDLLKESRDLPLVLLAARHLVANAPDPKAALTLLGSRVGDLRRSASARQPLRDELLGFALETSKKVGGPPDPQLASEIWTDCVLRYAAQGKFAELKPGGTLEQIAQFVGPDATNSGLQRFLEELFESAAPIEDAELARKAQILSSLPNFAPIARTVVETSLESKQPNIRAAALRFVIAYRKPDIAPREKIIAALNDSQDMVRVAAADAIAAFQFSTPEVLANLQKMVEGGGDEPIRAAGLRNLVVLSPNSPETRNLLTKLQNDSMFAVRSEAQQALKNLAPDKPTAQ